MLNFNISWGHVAALAVANFLLSWAWYSPALFYKPWMMGLGKDPNRDMKDMTEAEKKMMPILMANGLVASFIKVWVLAVLVLSLGAPSFMAGAVIGLLVWFGLTLTASLDTLWEGRKALVLVVNNGLFILTYMAFAGILAAWR